MSGTDRSGDRWRDSDFDTADEVARAYRASLQPLPVAVGDWEMIDIGEDFEPDERDLDREEMWTYDRDL